MAASLAILVEDQRGILRSTPKDLEELFSFLWEEIRGQKHMHEVQHTLERTLGEMVGEVEDKDGAHRIGKADS